ncbi:MAG: DUF45 domain-containing protein [Oscillospiraceae bacterium]|jgi:phosphoglycolate phosphatase-like HAD superfamily hydrolase|nr:DUF45 domain-containing protein [Oscillospiraceae bacterium]
MTTPAQSAPLVVFDLDGTLSQSLPVIIESVHLTLDALNYPQVTDELITSQIGEPYSRFFDALAPGASLDAIAAVYDGAERKALRKYGKLYDGAEDTLRKLRGYGCVIAMLSNGSSAYEEMLTEEFNIRGLFDLLVSGGDYSGKSEALAHIMRLYPNRSVFMVGDRKHDIQAALDNGVTGIAALYGYTVTGELDRAHYKINSVTEVADIVLRRSSVPQSVYPVGEFQRAALELIRAWESRLGVTSSYIGFRFMTSRWGSCTPRTRRIRLNSALEYLPSECLEYVAVHELAHIREGNHSRRFWAIVADALPDYKKRQAKLKELQWILQTLRNN